MKAFASAQAAAYKMFETINWTLEIARGQAAAYQINRTPVAIDRAGEAPGSWLVPVSQISWLLVAAKASQLLRWWIEAERLLVRPCVGEGVADLLALVHDGGDNWYWQWASVGRWGACGSTCSMAWTGEERGAGSAEERRVDWQEQGAGCGGVRLARRGARPPEEHWRWPGRGEAPLANGEDELVRSFFRNELILVLLTFV
jgi:hypothetical protein